MNKNFQLFSPCNKLEFFDAPLYPSTPLFQPDTDYFQGYTACVPVVSSQIDIYTTTMSLSPASSSSTTSPSFIYNNLTHQLNQDETETFLPEFHQYSKELYENGTLLKKRRRRRFDEVNNIPVTEVRRQVHIESEKKRRAQIKQGFDSLRKQLPGVNKKMSKVGLLQCTVQHLQYFKKSQITILTEIERLIQDNQRLKAEQGIYI
ncbi:hypothetical protein HPULCUR_006247 [Helicostylum pulchrum]|uniref:BHLH domain-containing protein n=1 Tax=Helicostylum pulchrum TaxID=562976 RepID=A0ABP9Y1Z3_9FUNG